MDAVDPGFLRFVFCASPLRRAAVFIALARVASGEIDDTRKQLLTGNLESVSSDGLADIARMLKVLRAKPIVTALWGTVPQGILGILRRLGVIDSPFTDPATYESLRTILVDPARRDRADALRALDKISETNVRVVSILEPLLLAPGMIQSLNRPEDAVAIGETLKLIRSWCPEASDEAIRMSVRSLAGRNSLTGWCERWAQRSTHLPDPGLPLGPDFRLLNSGRAIREAAARYRNCLMTKGPKILLARNAYYEHEPSHALVELKALSEGRWFLDGVYIRENKPVPLELERSIQGKLTAIGVLVLLRETAQGRRQAGVARMLGVWEDVDDDLLDIEAGA